MSYIYLREREEESSVECFSDIPVYVLSRLNLIAEKSCCNGSATESFQNFQSGTMCEHLTAGRGGGKSTSSAAASRARTYLAQGKERESKEREAGCGLNLQESLARYDPATHLWRTRQCSLFEGLGECLETFPKSGTMQGGVLWELTMLEPPHIRKRMWILAHARHWCGKRNFRNKGEGLCEQDAETFGAPDSDSIVRPSEVSNIVADPELFGNGRREQFEKSQQKEGNTSEVLSDAEVPRQPSGLNRQAQVQFGRSCAWWDRDPADQDGAFESQLGRVADGVANRVDRLKAIGNGQVPLVAATVFRLLKGNGDER